MLNYDILKFTSWYIFFLLPTTPAPLLKVLNHKSKNQNKVPINIPSTIGKILKLSKKYHLNWFNQAAFTFITIKKLSTQPGQHTATNIYQIQPLVLSMQTNLPYQLIFSNAFTGIYCFNKTTIVSLAAWILMYFNVMCCRTIATDIPNITVWVELNLEAKLIDTWYSVAVNMTWLRERELYEEVARFSMVFLKRQWRYFLKIFVCLLKILIFRYWLFTNGYRLRKITGVKESCRFTVVFNSVDLCKNTLKSCIVFRDSLGIKIL